MVVSLLGSKKEVDRRFAVEVIKGIRTKKKLQWEKFGGVRPFKKPKINCKADSLYNLNTIPLTSLTTEPPLTINMSNSILDDIVQSPLNVDLPLSTTAVERAVKSVTAAASKTSDPIEQDGISFLAEASRNRNKITNKNKKMWMI